VVEFSTGVTVQRGSQYISEAQENVTITAVDLSKAFPIVTYRCGGVNFDWNDYVRGTISSTTNLELAADTSGCTAEWQVIEYTNSAVQTGTAPFSPGHSSVTSTLSSAVDVNRSWLLFAYSSATGTISNIGQKMVRGQITDSNTLTFDRDNTGQPMLIRWYLVEFTDGTRVQHDSVSFGTSDTQKDVTLSPSVNQSRAIVTAGGNANPYCGGKTTYSSDDNPGVAQVTLNLTSSTNLRLTRSTTQSSTADIGWFVIEFADSDQPHVAWSESKTSGTLYYRNKVLGTWRSTLSWGTTYTGISVDVSPQNNYVNLARYYEAATNEIQYQVCKDLDTSFCDQTSDFTKWDGTAGADTVATAVESASYPSLVSTYEANGDLWIAYAKDVDGSTRAIYARYLDYPSSGWASQETVDSLSGTQFTRPSIGVDSSNNVYVLYVNSSSPQVYLNMRAGSWGTRQAIDTSSDHPCIMARSPNSGSYGSVQGGVYWKSSTSETYHVTMVIPEFPDVVIVVVLAIPMLIFGSYRRRAHRRLKK
jgi:hypothetical protein